MTQLNACSRRATISRIVLILLIFGFFSDSQSLAQRRGRGGPPRRMESRETITLESGSRIEFKTFQSKALGREMRYSIYFPASYDSSSQDYPVVYFLHGMNNDETSWCVERYGNQHLGIDRLIRTGKVPEFIMVHPDGERSFYTDAADGSADYEKYITQDLLQDVEGNFRIKKERRYRAIGGTSMGGYGSLKIAMRYPDLFGSAFGGSPIVLLGEDPPSGLFDPGSRAGQFFGGLLGRVYGNPVDGEHWKANNLEVLARTADLNGLRVMMIYGTADRYAALIPLEKGVRTLDGILKQRQISSRLEIFEGEPHGWELIGTHLEEAVMFMTESFR